MNLDSVIQLLGAGALFEDLEASDRTRKWAAHLKEKLQAGFQPESNGNLSRWLDAVEACPAFLRDDSSFASDAVSVFGQIDTAAFRNTLMSLKPWRKGPFRLFDLDLDCEWRSNLKWDRLAPRFDLQGKDILDVGCGNGYYGWRMLGAGARRVVGLDPYLLYNVQFALLQRLLGESRNYVLLGADTDIPVNLRLFDMVFSMGVLYHRKSPIEHLQSLFHSIKQGGELILETLIIEGGDQEVLIPRDRYAQMKNVWFLPSPGLLKTMIEKCGFREVEVLDMTRTTSEEQRQTEWMTFDSLADFLDSENPELTVEGYPAPLRAIVKARRP